MTEGPLRIVLYEGSGAEPLPSEERASLLTALLAKGHRVTVVRSGTPPESNSDAALLVLGRFRDGPPAEAQSPTGQTHVVFRNLTDVEASKAAEMVESVRAELQGPKPAGWKPWFPVIDYDRCTNCMQCLSFCLFDVYGVSATKQIQVQHPHHCKTDCPACSRVCPEVAILFPKYKHGPINGDVISPEDLRREAMKIDISALLGGDIYAALRDRSARAKSRFSKERDEERALKERQRCLAKLQSELNVPPEVLMSLPSPEEIQRRAEAAQARAAEAREQTTERKSS